MKRKGNRLRVITLLFIASVLVFIGCKKKEDIAVQQAAQPKVATKPNVPVQIQPSSAKGTASGVMNYDFKNKKDPFKAFLMPTEPSASKAKMVKARTSELLPIQNYDVSKFTVSGIITGLKENKALIIDPTGKGYVVRQGMLIGNNDGRITRISPSSIEISEQFRDDSGHVKKRKIVLPLAKKK